MKNIMNKLAIILVALLLCSPVFGQFNAPAWYPSDGGVVTTYLAGSAGNGTTTYQFEALIGSARDYTGFFLYCLYDAGDAGAAPQGQYREITSYTNATGLVTVAAFTGANLGTGDICAIASSKELQALVGANGVPAFTATEFTTGVSFAEGMGDINDDVDSLRSEIVSTTGIATFPTGVFHANGVSIAENAAWQSDTLRKVGVSTDSTLHYLHSTTGAPAVTGTFPAAGVSILERLGFVADTTRKIGVSTDSTLHYIHSTTGMPAVTGLFPAAGVSLNEKVQFIADTLRKEAVNTDSILAYIHSTTGMPAATGAFPAAGLSLNEKVQFLADSLRKVAVNSDSTLFYLHSTTGAPAVTGAFPAAGLSFLERIQFLADSLRKIGVTSDTVYSYLLTNTGAQWGTPTEPANGVNLFEGLGFTQNQLDSIVGAFYGDVGAQWGTATEPANGVDLLEGIGFAQNQLDSLQAALNGDIGNQWGTAAVPANGVAIDEVIRKISDATAGANGFSEWSEPVEVIVNFAAAGAWEEAATTHELYAVTGDVEFQITAFCSTAVTVTSADSIFFGAGDGAAANFSIWRCLGTDMGAGDGLLRGVGHSAAAVIPTAAQLGATGGVWTGTSMGGHDIGFDIDDNDFTAGIVVFYCRWRAITTGGSLVAGAGGAL